MKKYKMVLIGIFIFLVGCNQTSAIAQKQGTQDNSLTAFRENATNGVDLDLTVLSSTMVYSQVDNMVYEPDEEIGKTIKKEGL